jgi:ATP-binding cassette, subfamily C, bacterial
MNWRQQLVHSWGIAELALLIRKIPSHKLLALFILIVLGSLAEGFGILLLVPLIGLLNGDTALTTSLPPTVAALIADFPATLLACFVILIVARALLQQKQQNESTAMERRLIGNLRRTGLSSILHAQWRWLSAQSSSEHSALLLSDVARVGWGVNRVFTLVGAATSAAIYLTISLILSWQATLLAIFFGTAAYLATRRYRRQTIGLGEAIGLSNIALHRQIEETLAGAKLVKSLRGEQARMAALDNVLAQQDAEHCEVVAAGGAAKTMIDATSAVFLAVLTYAALRWTHIPADRLLPLIIIFARFIPLLAALQQGILVWLSTAPALRRLMAMIDDAQARAEPQGDNIPISLSTTVTLDGASFTYPGRDQPAFAPVSMTLHARTTTVITGPSGAGKSSIADILGGLMEPDVGRLLVDGVEIAGERRVCWRRSVAYVHQDTFFFDGSIAENLRLAKPSATDHDLWDILTQAAAGFVENLPDGLDTPMGTGGKRFSGGERQRLALARAILASPVLLILDEATSALDPETEAVVVATVEALRGTTAVIVISHRPIRGLTIDQHVRLSA